MDIDRSRRKKRRTPAKEGKKDSRIECTRRKESDGVRGGRKGGRRGRERDRGVTKNLYVECLKPR